MYDASYHNRISQLVRFIEQEIDGGYLFVSADRIVLIKEVNQELEHLANVLVIHLDLKSDSSILGQIKNQLAKDENNTKSAVVIDNLYSLFDREKEKRNIISELNFSREAFYEFKKPILFWVTEDSISKLINLAPDLYSQRRMMTIHFEGDNLQNLSRLKEFEIETNLPLIEKEETDELILLRKQYEEALNNPSISKNKLAINYLLPYAVLLSETNQDSSAIELIKPYLDHFEKENFTSLFNLGVIYANTQNYALALDYYTKSARLCEKEQDKPNLAVCYSRMGELFAQQGNLNKALTYFEERNKLGKELYQAYPSNVYFKNGLAISYSKLGETHSSLGNLDKALVYFDERNKLGKELHLAYPSNVSFKNGLAISYEKLGETHSGLGNLDKALTFFEDETKLFKELYQAYPSNVSFKNGLAISYEKLGDIQSSLGNLDKALTYFEDETKLFKELHLAYPSNVSFKNGLAISYEKLGDIQSSLGNLDKALVYFEERNKLGKELHLAYPSNVSFKNGLAISYEKLGETHSSLGNLDKALTYFEDETKLFKELHLAYPSNVSLKNGLAISYSQLGRFYLDKKKDKQTAIKYFEKCKSLWAELSGDFPSYVEFQNYLNWVKNKLASL